ncbi:MAG TPA: hypothetical protein VIS73_04400, partial [Rhodocyclaceae bacterium]
RVQGELLPAGQALLQEAALDGHWGLALVSGTPCDSRCGETLDALRRVHVALYKSMPAVRRLWLADGDDLAVHAEALHARWPDLALVVADPSLRSQLLAPPVAVPTRTLTDNAAIPLAADAVVVFDPAGRAVLRYGSPVDAKAVLTDLRRLLSPSR